MKLLKILIIFFPLLFLSITVSSQGEEEKGSLNSGSIESQYNYMYKKSGRHKDYRVIKIFQIEKFKKNVLDSLKLGRKKLVEEKTIVATQKNEIESLKLELGNTTENLTSVTEEKDSIKFLGIPLSKATYNFYQRY